MNLKIFTTTNNLIIQSNYVQYHVELVQSTNGTCTEIKNIRAIGEYRANNLLNFGHFFEVVILPISARWRVLKISARNIGQISLF